jgi:phage terminase large subunit-like protein
MNAESTQPVPGKNVDCRNYSLAAFERFCAELRVEDGTPLRLEPFQKRILRDHFAGTVEEVVVIPKKNGKSTLFSALALFHIGHWLEDDPEVPIGASSRDQATILYNQAAAMVERSGKQVSKSVYRIAGIDYDVRRGYRLIRLADNDNARIRVLAADANTADGVIPTLALVDELHRHPNGDLYGVFRDGLDGRDGRMVTMSTAGMSDDSALGLLRDAAQKLPTWKRKGTYCTARSEDGSFVLHEWSLTDDDDRTDLKLVKRANPASWQTVEKLRRRYTSPSMTPGRWARFACGVWTGAEEPWLEAGTWADLKVDIGNVKPGERVWVAIDVGTNPGIGIVAPREEGAAAVKAVIWEGDVPLGVIEQALVDLVDQYDVQQVAFDRVGFQRSAELLEARGLPMVEIPHSPERMSIVSQTLHRLIGEGKIRHDGDPVLAGQVAEAVTKETERGWRLLKSPGSRGLIAVAMAAHQATQVTPERRSVYEDRDMMTV